MIKIRALEYILDMHEVCQFRSKEAGPGPASNSELRRMLNDRAFVINGKRPSAKDDIELPVTSFVAWPKSPSKSTIL